MTQRHSHRSSRSQRPISRHSGSKRSSSRVASSRPIRNNDLSDNFQSDTPQTETFRPERNPDRHPERQWAESRPRHARSTSSSLVRLIEQDAPLFGRSQLVLMYGPFQAEMPSETVGVATWIKSCLRQHGIPSLVRFDDRRYAQVFRRDQFQPWVEHLIEAS
jgi:hypothetical protein